MTKKAELLNLMIEALKTLSFKSVDLLERFSYEAQDLPVCILKESSTEINTASSECWEHSCDLNLSIIDLAPDYELADELLGVIKKLPRDSFIFILKSTSLESKFEETPFYQITLNFEVRYYTQDYKL